MTFQIKRKEEGEREREREKRKEKREFTAVVRKVPTDQYMGVHDDDFFPYNNCTRNLLSVVIKVITWTQYLIA